MDVPFGPETARTLVTETRRLEAAGRDLAFFCEAEPGLAGECGIEIQALEARSILSGGAAGRVAALAERAALSGRPASVPRRDLDELSRLEDVLALASSRIARKRTELEATASGPSLVERLAPVLGGIVVDRAIGWIKSIF